MGCERRDRKITHRYNVMWLIAAVALATGDVAARSPAEAVSRCRADFQDHYSRAFADCLLAVAIADASSGGRVIRKELERAPGAPWLYFHLGRLEADAEKAIEILDRAVEEFSELGDHFGSASALVMKAYLLQTRDQNALAKEALRRAKPLIESLDKPSLNPSDVLRLHIDFLIESAVIQMEEGVGLDTLYREFTRVAALRLPDGRSACHSLRCLIIYGDLCRQIGDLERAEELARASLRFAQRKNLPWNVVAATYTIALCQEERLSLTTMPTNHIRERFFAMLDSIKEQAAESGHNVLLSRYHRYRGLISKGHAARREFELCEQFARVSLDSVLLLQCFFARAAKTAPDDPDEARAYLQQARALVAKTDKALEVMYVWPDALEAEWHLLPREEAIRRSLNLLELVERLREQQFATGTRASLFSVWTSPYYWVIGRMLDPEFGQATPAEVAQVFAITERLRARLLLDELAAARATPMPLAKDNPLEVKRSGIFGEMIEAKKRLFVQTNDAAREATTVQLSELESEAKAVVDQIVRDNPRYKMLERPRFASLKEVQATLEPDEALLAYQVAAKEDVYARFAGGSWLIAVTDSGVEVFPLPERRVLHGSIKPYLKLLERREDGEATASLALAHALLGEVLEKLPERVEELLIVPDGNLNLLPFAALSADGERHLIERFRLSVLPSASWWHQVREGARHGGGNEVMVLADPAFGSDHGGGGSAGDRTGTVPGGSVPSDGGPSGGVPSGLAAAGEGMSEQEISDLIGEIVTGKVTAEDVAAGDAVTIDVASIDVEELPLLPNARAEGKSIRRHLGPPCRLLLGEDASEQRLTRDDLSPIGVLHVAAHAVVDEQRPERSAVILAPGAGEDGALTIREIVELELDGKVVVLSACSSATGMVLSGEGVMSLARAFFQAGATAVVGSLWPLRDDEAARLFDAFYRHLGAGASLAGALQAAQLERLAAGAPAGDWAGVQVFGDGAFVPFPEGRRPPPAPGPFALMVGVAILAALGLRRLRNRKRPGDAESGVVPR